MRGKRPARLVAAAVLACAMAAAVSGVTGSSKAAAITGSGRSSPSSASFHTEADGGSGVWLDGRSIWTDSSAPAATGADATSSV
jgi:hypothetical protein